MRKPSRRRSGHSWHVLDRKGEESSCGVWKDQGYGFDRARQPCRAQGPHLAARVGFAGAFRRSELVALDVADLEQADVGLRVTIRTSKTDQEGEGQTVAVARGDVACPVKALAAWLEAAGISGGPPFRAAKIIEIVTWR
jgi:hypothetical protein